MWAYWLLFLVPAGIAFSPIKGGKNVQYMMWGIVGLLGILLIGLREYFDKDGNLTGTKEYKNEVLQE